MNPDEVIDHLKQLSSPAYREGMKRFGIDSSKALGVKLPDLRKLGKAIKKNHELALQLWDTGIHEARILASLIDDPTMLTPQQMDKWVAGFYSWDLCDQVCGNLFDRTPYVAQKVADYSTSEKEFIKRAGFVLMAEYAVHHKKAPDDLFIAWFPIICREAWDDRNFVKKAVNWALRQIGKRNPILNDLAIQNAEQIALQNSKAARWIAQNALAELEKWQPK